MKGILVALVVVALVGCATSPLTQDQAKTAPANRVLAFQTPAGPSDGTVVVIRDRGILGSGCRNVIYLDGKEVAYLSASEKASFNIPAGEHILGDGPSGNGLCGTANAKNSLMRQITITVKPQHSSTYRLAILGDGGGTLMPMSL